MRLFEFITDPIERILLKSFIENGIDFISGQIDPETTRNLDFYLPGYDIFIEVKQFHSDRISEQMSRVENVIAIQGRRAAESFVSMITNKT